MPMRNLARLNFLNSVTLFALAALVSVVGVYFIFNFYLDSLSRELMNNWAHSEAVAIEEGDLLGSITKNQRTLLASQFIKGVVLFDMAQDPPMPMIEFGRKIPSTGIYLSTPAGAIKVFESGFFSKKAVYKDPARSDLILVFDVESIFLRHFFFATVVALLFFVVVLFVSIKAVQRTEFQRRENFLKRALSDLVDTDQSSEFVERELPFVVKWWEQKRAENKAARELAVENESKIRLGNLAAQVSHDIGTPISTLLELLSDDKVYNKNLVNQELERVKSLMNKMLREYRGESEPDKVERFDLISLVSTALFEAKALSKGKCEITSNLPTAKILVDGVKSDLSSAILNVVKNAIQAIESPIGNVAVIVEQNASTAKILVKDNGCGIAEENLARVFEKDIFFRHGGTGLGLFQAKSAIEAMRGKITLHSAPGQGTTAEITLPCMHPLDTHITINVTADMHFVFVDDDRLIHDVWKKRLPAEVCRNQLHFFYSASEFRSWMRSKPNVNSVFFIDHDLIKGETTGIELIEEFGIHSSSYLVTGRAKELIIKTAAETNGIKLVDKNIIRRIQFRVNVAKEKIIFIDDSETNRIAWSIQAKKAGWAIETFASGEDFLRSAQQFDRATPIYVDYFFDGEPRGGELAMDLAQVGFLNVYLTTDYAREKIQLPGGVRAVVSKRFPGSGQSVQEQRTS